MRRTQRVISYVSMFLLLILGIGLMVVFLIQDGQLTLFARLIVQEYITPNLTLLGAGGAVLFIIAFWVMLKTRFTV